MSRVWGSGFRVSCLRFWDKDFGFRCQGESGYTRLPQYSALGFTGLLCPAHMIADMARF